MKKTITHYDLFAGIGGFSLALDEVFYEQKIKHIFSEWERFPTAVLKKHWPDATYYGDIDAMVEELTGMSAEEYNRRYGLSTVKEIRQRTEPLSKRDVSARHCELLRNIKAGDVEDFATERLRNATQSSICKGESLLQRDESERQGTKSTGEGGQERGGSEKDSVRGVRSYGNIQGWSKQDTSTSRQLSEAARGEMAMPEMSSRMAQTPQSKTINYDTKLTILTGGFPCQEFSHAGKRKGTAGARYKWPEMLALIHKIKPDWIIAENVRGLVSWERGLALETVCTNLEECGYSVQPLIIPAVAVNAPHRRERVWIVGYAKGGGKRQSESKGGRSGEPEVQIGGEYRDATNTRCEHGQHGNGKELEANQTERTTRSKTNQRVNFPDWSRDWQEVAFATCHDGMDDGLPRKLDGATERGKRTDQISSAKWRKESLRAYGNAIVPQVAMEIFRGIKATV